jgi:GNAT superfamily N-acetyltransferase
MSPWLAGTVFVHPLHRGVGIGSLLVEPAVASAAELGCAGYTSMQGRARFYEKLGWTHLFDQPYEREPVAAKTRPCA